MDQKTFLCIVFTICSSWPNQHTVTSSHLCLSVDPHDWALTHCNVHSIHPWGSCFHLLFSPVTCPTLSVLTINKDACLRPEPPHFSKQLCQSPSWLYFHRRKKEKLVWAKQPEKHVLTVLTASFAVVLACCCTKRGINLQIIITEFHLSVKYGNHFSRVREHTETLLKHKVTF